jgi:hypothetical protein
MSTGNEIELRQQPSLPAKVQYAKELANSGLLPAAYRRNPANVLYALEYGEMLGLSPMAAITGVHVIEGKPSASAGLISGLVRRAGHKLRVSGTNKSATCVIIRSDDPDHPCAVTWTLKRNADDNPSAEEAQLLGKQVWKNYPASMLKSRAITQCARDACEEALFGLHYTPEELGAEVDEDGAILGEVIADDNGDREQRPASAPAAQPEQPARDEAWIDEALANAAGLPTIKACQELWRVSAAKVQGGLITKADAQRVQDILRARMEDLRQEAAALPPEDPWSVKVESLASTEEAADAVGEVLQSFHGGHIGHDRRDVLLAAITARFPGAATETELAA